MLSFAAPAPIYLYADVADMRKSFDGLLGLVAQAGLGDPLSGAWFAFRNRRGDRLKILYFDRDGLAIWYKRLERGRFQWPRIEPNQSALSVQAGELRLILEGIDLDSVRRRRRWSRGESATNPVENPAKLDKSMAGARVVNFTDEAAASKESRRSESADRRAVRDGYEAPEPGGVAEPAVVRAQEREVRAAH